MTTGAFVRAPSTFREIVDVAGRGRYHLYVSAACPWCQRTVIVRKLKGLEGTIGLSWADPVRDQRGWAFTGGRFTDALNGYRFMAEAYVHSDPEYGGRISLPVLWDVEQGRIVNNESSEIIRIFNSATAASGPDLYPPDLRADIDAINDRVYETLNDGVYRCGFATTQAAYEEALTPLFATLDWLEQTLAERRFLLGREPTEADWRLFPTLVRFDSVYSSHFKCSLRRVVDYPNLWAYTRDLYQRPGIAETVALDEIKRHYFVSHGSINPSRIVPVGPALDFNEPHGRC